MIKSILTEVSKENMSIIPMYCLTENKLLADTISSTKILTEKLLEVIKQK